MEILVSLCFCCYPLKGRKKIIWCRCSDAILDVSLVGRNRRTLPKLKSLGVIYGFQLFLSRPMGPPRCFTLFVLYILH